MNSFNTPAREYVPGIGDAVADRTVNRKLPNGQRETWENVAYRVALGNARLHPNYVGQTIEFESMHHHLRQASLLMSGRHLQHGDETQPTRNQEVFTNCSTAASTFLSFYLLLNGSGVGRAYDDTMMLVDWCKNLPYVQCFIAPTHPDVLAGHIDAKFTSVRPWPGEEDGEQIYFNVPDSREGWAKAIEQIERLTFEAQHADKLLILDFSDVRPRGAPIGGMQNRPASGPGPLMSAIEQVAALKGQGMAAWKSTMHADHYMAECVLVGGARRAARMATKFWKDRTVIDFIHVKRGGVLWSSNNSVTVDKAFWDAVRLVEAKVARYSLTPSQLWDEGLIEDLELHAYNVFEALSYASYHDGTGEPGLINVDKLTWKSDGIEVLTGGEFAESQRYKLDQSTLDLQKALAAAWVASEYKVITNPCGEIVLGALGGYCVIADVVPFHAGHYARGFTDEESLAEWDRDAEDAFRTATRALIRTNLMDSLYSKEVERTNRIGVGITGLHEYAWERFGFGWKDLVDEEKSQPFWKMLAKFSNAVVDEAVIYSARLGVVTPHTALTMKPAGTTSKLFGLTEGAHLPSMREYLRWVQFRNDDPLVEEYRAKGYPVRELKSYSGTTIVGFPTTPTICTLGMGEKLVTAAEATPEEQYQYLRLLEKYWLHGYTESGMEPGVGGQMAWAEQHDYANQVSYTLKYDPKKVSYEEFRRTLLEGQSSVKCCSVMPQADTTAYEYQPEQPVTKAEFERILAAIKETVHEDIGFEHVDCGAGGCPISFNENQ